jgi:hypothetical protein
MKSSSGSSIQAAMPSSDIYDLPRLEICDLSALKDYLKD